MARLGEAGPVSLADIRREYARARLDEASVDPDPLRQLLAWLEEARAAGVIEPTAMTLSTSRAKGEPSARVVLLKGADERGLLNLKGHRSVGGMRASIYNAVGMDAVEALVAYMAEFEKEHG